MCFKPRPRYELHLVGRSHRGKIGYYTCNSDVPRSEILKLAEIEKKKNPLYLAIRVRFLDITYNIDAIKLLEDNADIIIDSTTQVEFIRSGVPGLLFRMPQKLKAMKTVAEIFNQGVTKEFDHLNPFSLKNIYFSTNLLYGENFDFENAINEGVDVQVSADGTNIDLSEDQRSNNTATNGEHQNFGILRSNVKTFLQDRLDEMKIMESLLDKMKEGHNEIPGITTPYFYVGHAFTMSSVHLEDFFLPSVNYLLKGSAPKYWLFLEASDMLKLNDILRTTKRRYKCPMGILHKFNVVTTELLDEYGISYDVVVQHEDEMIITYARGAHAVINGGRNLAVAMNWCYSGVLTETKSIPRCTCSLNEGFRWMHDYLRGTEVGMVLEYRLNNIPPYVQRRIDLARQQIADYFKYHAINGQNAVEPVDLRVNGRIALNEVGGIDQVEDGSVRIEASIEDEQFEPVNPERSEVAEEESTMETENVAEDVLIEDVLKVFSDAEKENVEESGESALEFFKSFVHSCEDTESSNVASTVDSGCEPSTKTPIVSDVESCIHSSSTIPSSSTVTSLNANSLSPTHVAASSTTSAVVAVPSTIPVSSIPRTVITSSGHAYSVPSHRGSSFVLPSSSRPSSSTPFRFARPVMTFENTSSTIRVLQPFSVNRSGQHSLPQSQLRPQQVRSDNTTRSVDQILNFVATSSKRSAVQSQNEPPRKKSATISIQNVPPDVFDEYEYQDLERKRRERVERRKRAAWSRKPKPATKPIERNQRRYKPTNRNVKNMDRLNEQMKELSLSFHDEEREEIQKRIDRTRRTILRNDLDHILIVACENFNKELLEFHYQHGMKPYDILKNYVSAINRRAHIRLWNLFRHQLFNDKLYDRGFGLYDDLKDVLLNQWKGLFQIQEGDRVPADDVPVFVPKVYDENGDEIVDSGDEDIYGDE